MPEQTELSREELIELLAFAYGSIDSQFELWLTITFAVIMLTIVILRNLVWLIGTVVTVFFILKGFRERNG